MGTQEFRPKSKTKPASSQHCGKWESRLKMYISISSRGRILNGSIDRLGRNYTEILEQWRIITKNKRAAIVILDMPLLDTRQNRDLTGQLIADIVLQLLSYVAQTEREFIRQRQAEGISAARERGVRFGRDPAEIPLEFPLVYREWRAKKLGSRAAAERLGVSQTTFLKWAKAENLPKK